MRFDYLIVGSGLAGLMLCENLRKRGKSFKVISNSSQQASVIASGLYNPVVLKRFNKAWNADQQLPLALSTYNDLEIFLGIKVEHQLPIYRVFHGLDEQNNWFLACDKPDLKPFLIPKVIKNHNTSINAPFGYGEVKQTGRVDTKLLLESYVTSLKSNGLYFEETFNYNALELKMGVNYKGLLAKQIIFTEGFGLKQNPFFNKLPLDGTKGELLLIHAPVLNSEVILKSSVFIIPIGSDKYLVGSTYAWNDHTNTPTESAKNSLINKLQKLLNCSFKILQQWAGIRPTVIDRRPLVGQHKVHKNLYILNGLGTRGVLIAPTVAENLIDFIEDGIQLSKEIDINRFTAYSSVPS